MFLKRIENDADSLSGVEEFQSARVEQVIAEMRKGVDGPLSLGDMADMAHLSTYHFARTFRRVTGVPPGEFLSAPRLEEAKRLLLTTDLSVSEVCFEAGYNSLGTFTTRFKQLVGMSPGRLRRLPEEAAPILDLLAVDDPFPSPSYTAGVHGQITASDTGEVLIFVGLFRGAIPQRYSAAPSGSRHDPQLPWYLYAPSRTRRLLPAHGCRPAPMRRSSSLPLARQCPACRPKPEPGIGACGHDKRSYSVHHND